MKQFKLSIYVRLGCGVLAEEGRGGRVKMPYVQSGGGGEGSTMAVKLHTTEVCIVERAYPLEPQQLGSSHQTIRGEW